MRYTMLIVEDEDHIREYLEETFKEAGFRTRSTGDGAQALRQIEEQNIDLVLLDLGIKTVNGETVCIEAKKAKPDLPIIILTARNATEDIVHGLKIGADDYISKPFDTQEIIARVNRRLKSNPTKKLTFEDLELNANTMEVKRDGKAIMLTPQEFRLLEYLLINKGIVLSREAIIDHIWMYSQDIETRVVDVYIGYLRKKIDSGHNKKLIHSIRGFGYTIKSS